MATHVFQRKTQAIVKRKVRVVSKQQFSPDMLRITFHSDELAGFESPSADDHIKLFVPDSTGTLVGRDFTPVLWNPQAQTLSIDVALHQDGPAVAWAKHVEPDAETVIAGPRGSSIAPNDFDWYLLIGDATALPSISRRLDELQGKRVQVIALVSGKAEERYLSEPMQACVQWLSATGNLIRDRACVLRAIEATQKLEGDGFVWIAAETSIARAAYRYVTETLAHPKEWIKAAGYWSAGVAEGGERIA